MKDLFGEEFLEGIEKAKRLIPEKPTIVVKNATVTGVKLNSKIINSIPKSEEPISFYEGIKVYQDDSLDKPRFIVEGEIETKKYLKWEDLVFEREQQSKWVKLNGNSYFIEWFIDVCGAKKVKGWHKLEYGALKYAFYIQDDAQFFNDLRLEMEEEKCF